MLTFNSIFSYKEGYLFEILNKSYSELLNKDIKDKIKYVENWKQFDRDSFNQPQIGKCVLITCLNYIPIGFASYDPRHFPNFGIIGHNCILPEYRNQGYGKLQIENLLKIFTNNRCRKAKVSTGEIEFFLPAQKMYKNLGFKEVRKYYDKIRSYNVIEYEKDLL